VTLAPPPTVRRRKRDVAFLIVAYCAFWSLMVAIAYLL
jgi:hypothetical protein